MKITKGGSLSGFATSINAGDVTVTDPGGLFPPGLTLEEILALLAAGTVGGFLTVIRGGQGTVQNIGPFGAIPTIDLNNANYFYGSLDQDATFTTTGWTSDRDSQITVEMTNDGGYTPTFSGVTWIGGDPSWDTTAGTVTFVILFSRDGGVTIYGAVVGGGSGADHSLETVTASGTAQTVDVSVARTYDITLTANCTITMAGGVSGQAWVATVILRQGGSGSYTVTWDPDIDWQDTTTGLTGGSPPTLYTAVGAENVVDLATLDGGTSWGGRYDAVAPTAASISSLGFVGAILITDTPAGSPLVFADLVQNEAGTDLLYADI